MFSVQKWKPICGSIPGRTNKSRLMGIDGSKINICNAVFRICSVITSRLSKFQYENIMATFFFTAFVPSHVFPFPHGGPVAATCQSKLISIHFNKLGQWIIQRFWLVDMTVFTRWTHGFKKIESNKHSCMNWQVEK